MSDSKPPVEIFYCYSRKDEDLRARLDAHLSTLRRSKLVRAWYDRGIPPGTDWRDEIDRHLESADLILLLVSADFINSDFCHSVEMKRALERHDRGEARVVPIILKPVDWEDAPFAKLQVLPRNGKPIASRHRDTVLAEVAVAIREVVKEIIEKRPPSKGKILAVEDDPVILEGYIEFLEQDGYRVLPAVTGREGMRLLNEHPDTRLILLDLNLPDLSGADWMAWYRQQGKQIPVIVASGQGDILKVALGNNVTAIAKPFGIEELKGLIETVLNKKPPAKDSTDRKLH